MINRVNTMGGVHFEEGRGYRASITVNGVRVRSQRVKTRKEATLLLNRIRRALISNGGKNLDVESTGMLNLYRQGKVSISNGY